MWYNCITVVMKVLLNPQFSLSGDVRAEEACCLQQVSSVQGVMIKWKLRPCLVASTLTNVLLYPWDNRNPWQSELRTIKTLQVSSGSSAPRPLSPRRSALKLPRMHGGRMWTLLRCTLWLLVSLQLGFGSVRATADEPDGEVKIEVVFKPEQCSLKSKRGDLLNVHYDGFLAKDGSQFYCRLERIWCFTFTRTLLLLNALVTLILGI